MGMLWARIIATAAVLCSGGALAVQPVKSLYTALDPAACRAVPDRGRGVARVCEGLPGYPVYVAEGDRGVFLSVGPEPEARRAAQQTLGAVNTLFEKNGQRPTVEWRFIVRDGKTVPYATIVRYRTRSRTDSGEVLVVMRVTERDACHVAYIDALANPDAIVRARRIADTVARSEPCPDRPRIDGVHGQSPM